MIIVRRSSCPPARTQLQMNLHAHNPGDGLTRARQIRMFTGRSLSGGAFARRCSGWSPSPLFLRVGWIIVAHTYRFKPVDNNFGFGWEMGRIGAGIAPDTASAIPSAHPTGPTAWEPPLYPYLVGWRVQDLRHLFPTVGVRAALDQQHFFGADLYADFPHRAEDFFREGRGGRSLDVGSAALRDVLVHALGLGDQPFRAPDGRDFLARALRWKSATA